MSKPSWAHFLLLSSNPRPCPCCFLLTTLAFHLELSFFFVSHFPKKDCVNPLRILLIHHYNTHILCDSFLTETRRDETEPKPLFSGF
ncbi:hypothetical protein Mapa_002266 [Marchantia paleacea]|nr:hypothetical protein Mapa_002266 [Marchantia paleacea]